MPERYTNTDVGEYVDVDVRTVEIPATAQHKGLHRVEVRLIWRCPECGGPRGEITNKRSYDGSLNMIVDGWDNPCGHVDKYSDVRREAISNGLNPHLYL